MLESIWIHLLQMKKLQHLQISCYYHVYSGAVNAADVTDGLTVAMVNGDDASFTVTDGTVMVGGCYSELQLMYAARMVLSMSSTRY